MVLLSFNIYLSSVEAFARGAQNLPWLLGLLLGLKKPVLKRILIFKVRSDNIRISK